MTINDDDNDKIANAHGKKAILLTLYYIYIYIMSESLEIWKKKNAKGEAASGKKVKII